MRQTGIGAYDELHRWSVDDPAAFWTRTVEALGIRLRKPFNQMLDVSAGVPRAKWLVGAEMNIAESCVAGGRDRPAIVTRRHDGNMKFITLGELDRMSNRVANGLRTLSLNRGDAIAIDMPMTAEAVAIYLGIVKAGCIVVSIPDSFPADQIAKRLNIGDARAVFTQDVILQADKTFPMYEKVRDANAPVAVALPSHSGISERLRDGDLSWEVFLSPDDRFEAVVCSPQAPTNYIFSSGTTGDPKCIPWDHTTPIKCASDGMYHHDIRAGDVVCWPTNLGWMMGPWLVYASLLNKATIALYEGAPSERHFSEFVQDAKVTMLGLVLSIAANWRNSRAADGFDWSSLRCFSSSGEASNPDVYGWLMGLNQPPGVLKPIIEYCGGTEIGGGYVCCRQNAELRPSQFNCQAMGIEFVVLDDDGHVCGPGEAGEVFISSPSIGLTTRLHKGDNEKVYYQGARGLRRHGDRIICLKDGGYKSDGRADGAMNLNGIKIGSTEIESVANTASADVVETAAIGVPVPGGGPDRLVIFAVVKEQAGQKPADSSALKRLMQQAIAARLNPQFRVQDVVLIDALPRTASHKVMHRKLRELYVGNP